VGIDYTPMALVVLLCTAYPKLLGIWTHMQHANAPGTISWKLLTLSPFPRNKSICNFLDCVFFIGFYVKNSYPPTATVSCHVYPSVASAITASRDSN
jgi:hypothetical protein